MSTPPVLEHLRTEAGYQDRIWQAEDALRMLADPAGHWRRERLLWQWQRVLSAAVLVCAGLDVWAGSWIAAGVAVGLLVVSAGLPAYRPFTGLKLALLAGVVLQTAFLLATLDRPVRVPMTFEPDGRSGTFIDPTSHATRRFSSRLKDEKVEYFYYDTSLQKAVVITPA